MSVGARRGGAGGECEAASRVGAGLGTKARRVEHNFFEKHPSLTRLTNLSNSGLSDIRVCANV